MLSYIPLAWRTLRYNLARWLCPSGYSLVPTPWIDGSWEKSAIPAAFPNGPQFEIVGRKIERMEVAATEGGEVLRIHSRALHRPKATSDGGR